jgi:hypothetical protein
MERQTELKFDDFEDIAAPTATANPATADQVVHGPAIPPQQRILLYSPTQWEDFIHEWAHYCLKKQYQQVQRFTGAGDRGIDIAGFVDSQKLQGVWDNFQCKHYDHALHPTDVWAEVGKIIWYSFNKEYKAPRKYFLVAPFGVGTTLAGYLADAAKLKLALMENWDKHVKDKITSTQEVKLEGELKKYVEAFDYTVFDSKTSLQIIEDHKDCPLHAVRFGGGLPARPESEKPPDQVAAKESRYVAQLLGAYADHTKEPVPNLNALKTWPKLNGHFDRQREAFYHAESLRVFARDTVPSGTFEPLQDDIHAGVIDTCDEDHADGYTRVCEVTKTARSLHLTSNALLTCAKPKDRDGICHQLANEDRLLWKKS